MATARKTTIRKPAQNKFAQAASFADSGKASSDSPRVKATYNLSPEVAKGLDTAWLTLRVTHGIPCSKSELVEIALQNLIADIENKDGKSPILKQLSGKVRRS